MAVNNNGIMARLLVIEITFLILAVVNSYPAFEDNGYKHRNRDKGRTIRGFKNMDLSTARGFGKRADHLVVNLMPPDMLVDNKDDDFNQNMLMDGSLEKLLKNKYFARNLIENIIHDNRDGYIFDNELLQTNVLLVALVCVVHYDLFGLFPSYLYKQYTYTTDKQQRHQHQPSTVEFDYMWLPKPGTDTNGYYSYPTVLTSYDDDDDDHWAEVRNADDDDAGNGGKFPCPSAQADDGGTCSTTARGDFDQTPKTAAVDNNHVHVTPADEVPSGNFKDEHDGNDDYIAPGEERDEDVF